MGIVFSDHIIMGRVVTVLISDAYVVGLFGFVYFNQGNDLFFNFFGRLSMITFFLIFTVCIFLSELFSITGQINWLSLLFIIYLVGCFCHIFDMFESDFICFFTVLALVLLILCAGAFVKMVYQFHGFNMSFRLLMFVGFVVGLLVFKWGQIASLSSILNRFFLVHSIDDQLFNDCLNMLRRAETFDSLERIISNRLSQVLPFQSFHLWHYDGKT